MMRLIRSEWTKFRSVRRWVIASAAGAVLAIVLSTFFATSGSTNANDGPQYVDQFHFVHQPLTGDGTIVAQVTSQDGSHEWAKAGLMVKESAKSGAPYVALFVTPGHGVRLQSNFGPEVTGTTGTTPRWLRLSRTGTQLTGFESTDGTQWTPLSTVNLAGLPATAEVGLFVTSPAVMSVDREFGSTTLNFEPTLGRAIFDRVSLTTAAGGAIDGEWLAEDVVPPEAAENFGGLEPQLDGVTTVDGDTFTVEGSGDVGGRQWGDDDAVLNSLAGVLLTLIVIIVVSALFITSEFRKGLIRTTFTAAPRRGGPLLAKAAVIAPITFVAGLVAAAGSYAISRPAYAANGYTAPSYPELPLHDPTVLRAVIGSALMLSLVAVLSLSVGAILRRGAATIALLMAVMVAPPILLGALPLDVALWIGHNTPVAGMAIMQTRERWDTAISPWGGLGVLAAYALVALVVAVWRVSRRDA